MSTPSAVDCRARDLRARVARDALLAERLLELRRHRLVFDRHEARQQLEDRDLAAEAAEDRRELDADGAAAEDRDRLRAPRCRWIASSLVMMRVRSISMPGTLRGAEPVATMISLRARSVCVVALEHVDAAVARQPRRALDPVDLVLLEQELDALRQAADDRDPCARAPAPCRCATARRPSRW